MSKMTPPHSPGGAARPFRKQTTEFELRRRVFAQARSFFDCADDERRLEHLAELETCVAAYYRGRPR